jgi:hypothetical protein
MAEHNEEIVLTIAMSGHGDCRGFSDSLNWIVSDTDI